MFDAEIQSASRLWNVPISWIKAVIQTESSWNPNAHNASDPSGAYGLMQVLYSTAQALGYTGPATGLYDPATNINLGTELLWQLRNSYGDDFRRVYSAYNSGNPDLWQTSEQVASNVARALAALLSYGTENSASSVLVFAVAFLLIWIFRKKKI